MTTDTGVREWLAAFRSDDHGHVPDCPMLDAYDNDGCDCAAVLLSVAQRAVNLLSQGTETGLHASAIRELFMVLDAYAPGLESA